VFARMKPSDKQFIVEQLQHMTEAEAHVGLAAAEVSTRAEVDEDEEIGNMQVSTDEAHSHRHPDSGTMRQTLVDRATALVDMHNDGRGSLHVLFCGDGKSAERHAQPPQLRLHALLDLILTVLL
jgi:hypothetical protein